MANDEELLIYNSLVDNWIEGNAATPRFYYDDSIKLHDFGQFDAIKIYTVNMTEKPHGLGYTSYETEVYLTIDIRSKSRTRMLACRDEIKRIIRSLPKTTTGYDIFRITHERKVASYINYFQYIIEVRLHKYRTII